MIFVVNHLAFSFSTQKMYWGVTSRVLMRRETRVFYKMHDQWWFYEVNHLSFSFSTQKMYWGVTSRFLMKGNPCFQKKPSRQVARVKLTTTSLWRRANARNVSFSISVRWSIYIINSVDKPNFRVSVAHRRSTTVSLETNPLDH